MRSEELITLSKRIKSEQYINPLLDINAHLIFICNQSYIYNYLE